MYVMGEEEIEAVRRVVESRALFRYRGTEGECARFEAEFAEVLGSGTSALLLSSGTNALVAGLRALGIGAGDEVLVPAYTYVATAAAVRLVGAVPVIVGIDSELGMSAEDARSKCGPRTRAMIPVHMDGLSAEMESLLDLARAKNLLVLEDCAQAMGGSYRGRRLGTLGDAGAFSLNESKIISCGEGGIFVCSDRARFERAFNAHDLAARFSPLLRDLFRIPPEDLGMSMRVSEIHGAIMRVQLRRLEDLLARLRHRKTIFAEALRGFDLVRGGCASGDCGTTLHLRFRDPAEAAAAAKRLSAAGIRSGPPTMRPAHAAWKWREALGLQLDPMEMMASMERLSSVVRFELDPLLSESETRALGDRMRALL